MELVDARKTVSVFKSANFDDRVVVQNKAAPSSTVVEQFKLGRLKVIPARGETKKRAVINLVPNVNAENKGNK